MQSIQHSSQQQRVQAASALNGEDASQQHQDKEEEKSFIQKYWHILLPLFLWQLISGMKNAANEVKAPGAAAAGGPPRS